MLLLHPVTAVVFSKLRSQLRSDVLVRGHARLQQLLQDRQPFPQKRHLRVGDFPKEMFRPRHPVQRRGASGSEERMLCAKSCLSLRGWLVTASGSEEEMLVTASGSEEETLCAKSCRSLRG